jgi:glycosyltransferase involved in cell wall biosynthesis
MSEPLVSVLMAVRDGEPFIRAAVESVLGQTLADFELLVVDDASEDGTAALVESYGDERIRLVRLPSNVGQAPALNLGLAECRGLYVARLDADDACLPQRLERQVATLDADPGLAVVGSWMEYVDEEGRTIGFQRGRIRTRAQFVFQTLVSYVLISHPAAMYRRAVALELGGYDPELAPSEDKDLWRRMLLAGWDGRIVEEPLVRYRIHAQQLSQVQAERQRRTDVLSQERFLLALDPSIDAVSLRQLLAGDDRVWRGDLDPERLTTGLDRLIAATQALAPGDEVERLVAARVARNARRGWRGSIPSWWRTSLAVQRWASARLPFPEAAGEFALHLAAIPAAPVLHPARLAERRAVRGVAHIAALQRLRRRASHSRLLRQVYGRLLGTR